MIIFTERCTYLLNIYDPDKVYTDLLPNVNLKEQKITYKIKTITDEMKL